MRNILNFKNFILALMAFSIINCAEASSLSLDSSGPWSGFQTFIDVVTGPIAKGIALFGLIGSLATLIFMGGELNQLMKTLVYTCLVICCLVLSPKVINMMTGDSSGAVLNDVSSLRYYFN